MSTRLTKPLLEAIAAALDAALAGDGFDGGDFDGMSREHFERAREWAASGKTAADDHLAAAASDMLEALKMVREVGLADEDGAGQVEAAIDAAIDKAVQS